MDAAMSAGVALRGPGGKITFLNVIEELPRYAMAHVADDFTLKSRDFALDELKKLQAKIDAAEIAYESGHPGRTIVDFAERAGVDCIVVASHQPGVQDFFLGSTAAHVLRHARCAVHVVR